MNLFARKRRVRVHFSPVPGPDGSSVEVSDIEGVLAGRVGDRYLLLVPRLLQSREASFSLDNAVEIPRSRVWFMERLAAE